MTEASMTDAAVGATPTPEKKSHGGWLAAFAIVTVLLLGAIAAGVISRGDDGKAQTSVPTGPTVQQSTTINAQPAETVTKTVTTPPSTIEVQPQVTVQGAPSGETPTTPTSP